MALTPSQQRAADNLSLMQSRSASDYATQSLDDYINSNATIQDAQSSSEGVYSPAQIAKLRSDLTAQYNSTGAGAHAQQTYDGYLKQATDGVEFNRLHPSGNDSNWLDHFMEFAIPAAVTMMVGGSMGGLFDGAATAAGGADVLGASVAGDTGMGLGAQAINTGALQDLGFLNGIGGADAAAGAAGLGGMTSGGTSPGLGNMVGVEGGAPAVVNVGPPAAAGGGLGTGGAALGASIGLGSVLGSNPSMPIDTGTLQQMPGSTQSGVPINEADLPGAPNVPLNPMPPINPVADGAANLPIGTGGLGGGSLPSIPGGIGSAIGGLGGLVGANVDRIKNQQDQDYWQGLMDKMMGMYTPGTAEANQMQSSMDAKDAAAGRNSQYGTRAVNLGAALAGQRANIMTSPTFYKMGEAARGHYDNSLNSLFSQLGNYSGNSGSSSTGGGLSSLLGLGSQLLGGSTTTP